MSEPITIDEALQEVFTADNEMLSLKLGVNYNTIASWRFNFRHKTMSNEKKSEILTKLNYKLIEQSKWKKHQK